MVSHPRTPRQPATLCGLRPAAVLLALLCGPSLPTCALHAQSTPAVRHTVDGIVINGAKAPIANAIVYLENPKSLDVRSYLTDAEGHYHFSQIAPQTDYEVWAEQNGHQSKHKFISQFSNHNQFHLTLTLIAGGKKHKLLGIF